MTISAIIPAFNAEWCLDRAIVGLREAGFGPDDIIVVDDGSADRTPDIARCHGVRLVRLKANAGAAGARNAGAEATDAEILLFVDADVVIAPHVRGRVLDAFAAEPGLDAIFGLYDDVPHCRGAVAQFRNLLHHFVHLNGPDRPHSFWTGCGAVRRAAFDRLGGFNPRLRMMEDVEFGLRLTQAGGRIRLDRCLRAKHLKCWSLAGMIRMDVHDRAIPWSRLLLFRHALFNELNLDVRHRLSAAAALAFLMALVLAPLALWPGLLVAGAALALFLWLNRTFHALVFRRAGWWSGIVAVPLHLTHNYCAALGLAWVVLAEYLPLRLFNRPPPAQARHFAAPSVQPVADPRP